MDLQNMKLPESGFYQAGILTGHHIPRFINSAVAVSISKFKKEVSTLIF
jgi:hypothetical protein